MSSINLRDNKISEAEKYIRKNFSQPLTITGLCKRFGFSTSGFRRYWQAKYSVTPWAFINQLRLEKACSLLLETDMDLEMISQEIGYNDSLYLSRKFKQTFGLAPTYFRKKSAKGVKSKLKTAV